MFWQGSWKQRLIFGLASRTLMSLWLSLEPTQRERDQSGSAAEWEGGPQCVNRPQQVSPGSASFMQSGFWVLPSHNQLACPPALGRGEEFRLFAQNRTLLAGSPCAQRCRGSGGSSTGLLVVTWLVLRNEENSSRRQSFSKLWAPA